jgi:undecaprenyl-diphosphatase
MDAGILPLLLAFDHSLFTTINGTLQTKFLDFFMPFITDFANFRLLLILSGSLFLVLGGRQEREMVVWAVLLLGVSDFVSSHVVKELFYRPRPCLTFSSVRLLASCTSSFSFPSSHAVNITAQMVFFSSFYPRLRIPLYGVAFLVAYSRVYVGVHYPTDVVGGILIGFFLSYGLLGLRHLIRPYIQVRCWQWDRKHWRACWQRFLHKREARYKGKEPWVQEP